MYCKKCGNRIKEGNTFCTNCGTNNNDTKLDNKKPIKLKLKTVIWLLLICALLIVFFAVTISRKMNMNGNNINISTLNNNENNKTKKIKEWQVNENGEITNGELILHIGDFINYNEQEGAINTSYISDTSTYDNYDGQEFTLNQYKYGWRLLGVENGQLLLISEDIIGPDTGYKSKYEDYGRLYLFYTSWGYSNIIKDLNNICSIYGQGYRASKSRSINIEDINKITGFNANSYSSSDYKYYPETLTDSSKSEKRGLNKDSIEYELLFKNPKTNTLIDDKYKDTYLGCRYWLANKYGTIEYGLTEECINCVLDGRVCGITLFSSNNNNGGVGGSRALGVRPVIYLDRNVELITSENGSYDIK